MLTVDPRDTRPLRLSLYSHPPITTPAWGNIAYKFGLLLVDQVHPLLPEVKEVHDGAQNGQSLLFF